MSEYHPVAQTCSGELGFQLELFKSLGYAGHTMPEKIINLIEKEASNKLYPLVNYQEDYGQNWIELNFPIHQGSNFNHFILQEVLGIVKLAT